MGVRKNIKSLGKVLSFVQNKMETEDCYQSFKLRLEEDEIKAKFWNANIGGTTYYGETRSNDTYVFNDDGSISWNTNCIDYAGNSMKNRDGVVRNCQNLHHVASFIQGLDLDKHAIVEIEVDGQDDCIQIYICDNNGSTYYRYHKNAYMDKASNHSAMANCEYPVIKRKRKFTFGPKVVQFIANWILAPLLILSIVGGLGYYVYSKTDSKPVTTMAVPTNPYNVVKKNGDEYYIIEKAYDGVFGTGVKTHKSVSEIFDVMDHNEHITKDFVAIMNKMIPGRYRYIGTQGSFGVEVLDDNGYSWSHIYSSGSNVRKLFKAKRYNKELADDLATLLNKVHNL